MSSLLPLYTRPCKDSIRVYMPVPNSKYRSPASLPAHHHRGPASPAASLPLQALGRCTPAPRPPAPPDGKPTRRSHPCMLLYITLWVPSVIHKEELKPRAPFASSRFSRPHAVSLFLHTSHAPLLSVKSHGVYLDAPTRPQLRAPLSRALRRELRKQPHRAWTPPSRSFSRRSPAHGLGCVPRRADRQISGMDAGAPPRSPSLWAIKPSAKASPSPTPSTTPP